MRLIVLTLEIPATPSRTAKLRLGVSAMARAPTRSDLENLVAKIRRIQRSRREPLHTVMLFVPEPLDEDLRNVVEGALKRLSIRFVEIPIARLMHRVKLAAIGRAISETAPENSVQVATNLENSRSTLSSLMDVDEAIASLREIAEELSLHDHLKNIVRPPTAITDIPLIDPVTRHRDYVDAMKWLLSAPWTRASIEEFYEFVSEKLTRMQIHGLKRGLLALDIESPSKLREYAEAAHRLGLVRIEEGRVDTSRLSSIEERMLSIVENVFEGVAPLEALKKFFIDASTNFDKIFSMYLEILQLRGLLCVARKAGECPGTELRNVAVSLRRGDVAKQVVEECRERVEELIERLSDRARRFGYIVSGKERGWRAFTVMEALDFAREMADRALKVLTIDMATALRLRRVADDVVSYVESVVEPLMTEAETTFRRIRRLLEDHEHKARKLIESIESLINNFIASSEVRVRVGALERLREAISKIDAIENEVLTPQQLESVVSEIWSRARGKDFPFYFRTGGSIYRFNYKLYRLHCELRPFVEVDEHGALGVSPVIESWMDRLERLVDEVRSAIESVIKPQTSIVELFNEMKSSEILRPIASSAPRIDFGRIDVESIEVDSIEDLVRAVRSVVGRWVARSRDIVRRAENLEKVVKRIIELEHVLRERSDKLSQEIERFKSVIDTCGHVYSSSSKCLRSIEDVARSVDNVLKTLEAIRARSNEELPQNIDELEKRLRGILEALERLEKELSTERLAPCIELENEVRKFIDSRMRSLETLIEAFSSRVPRLQEVGKKLSELAAQVERSGLRDACRVVYEIERMDRDVRELVVKSGVLTREEMEVYAELMKVRSSRGSRLRLSEAIEVVASRLLMRRSVVKRVVMELIEKEVLDVYI